MNPIGPGPEARDGATRPTLERTRWSPWLGRLGYGPFVIAGLAWMLALGATGCNRSKPPEPAQTPERRTVVRRIEPRRVVEEAPATNTVEPARQPGASGAPDLARGFTYRNERVHGVPWSINLLLVDRSRTDLQFTTTFGRGTAQGLGPLSEQIDALPVEVGEPLAAINGDFYRTEQEPYAGDPRGVQIVRGELVSAPNRKTAFWVDTQGNPQMGDVLPHFKVTWPDAQTTPFGLNEERHANDAVLYTSRIGPSTGTRGGRELVLIRHGEEPWLPLRAGQSYSAEVREVRESGNTRLNSDVMVLSIGPMFLARVPRVKAGEVLQISTATSPDLRGVPVALGGGPVILHGGNVQSAYDHKSYERHPRSAFGWNDRYFFLAEVDGRQYGFSVGMTLAEMANYLAQQGCQEAMNMDGGGSAEMWVQGQVVNRPCFGYERNTANGLVLVKKARPASASGQ